MLNEESVVISKRRYQEILDDIDELKYQNQELLKDLKAKDDRIKAYEKSSKVSGKKV